MTLAGAIEALEHAGSALRAGQGGLLLLHGPRGVGISHLVNAWAYRNREEFLVARTAASSLNPTPYAPWRRVLSEIDALWAPGTTVTIDPMSGRSLARRLVETVRSAGAPTVIIIDDWDEADPGSQRVVELLDAEMQLENLLVVLAADVRASRASSTRPKWPARRIFSVLVTGPSQRDVTEILGQRYPGAPADKLGAASGALIATCGHNLAAILVWLRHLEAQHLVIDVVNVIAHEAHPSIELADLLVDPVLAGAPSRVIAQLVEKLGDGERLALGAWMLAPDLSAATVCELVDIPGDALDAAVRAGHHLGLIATVWTPAREVHSLVSEAIWSSLFATDMRRVHLALARHYLTRNESLTAVEHFLRAGPESPIPELVEALQRGLVEATLWRSHDQIEAISSLISQVAGGVDRRDVGADDGDRQVLDDAEREMAAVVEKFVSALSQGDLRLINDQVGAATAIADRADSHHLVLWAWQLRAVQALLAGDQGTLEHCSQLVLGRRRLGVDHTQLPVEFWTEFVRAQLSGEWSGETAVNGPRIEAAYLAVQRGDGVGLSRWLEGYGEVLLAAASDADNVFSLVMTAEIVAATGDREQSARLLEKLRIHSHRLAVHPEGRAVLLPVASAAADLAEVLGDFEESHHFQLVATEVAERVGAQWMIVAVADAATQRLVRRLGLSDRELAVARLISQGLGMGEIAEQLSYSPSTIRRVVAQLQSLLEVRDRRGLRVRLREVGIAAVGPAPAARI
jgi:DNA-binding CsgD family transcriptional regulator